MRYKVAPPPRSLGFLERARGAIPLVPGDEADCCRAIQRETDVGDRETAQAYLVFLRALGLVAESDRGYYRTKRDFEPEQAAEAFRRSVFGVDALVDAFADGSLDPDDAFDALREDIPRWERERHADWEAVWRERTENLLEWAVEFGLAEKTAGEYVARRE